VNMGHILAALGIGLAGGFAGGMLGIGGGAIYVPAMVFLLGENQHSAQGASLAAIVPTAIVGSVTHLRNQNIDVPVVVQVVPGAIVAAFIAGFVADKLDANTLQRIFGVVMAYLALNTIWSALRRDAAEQKPGG
jgi:uncharacterized protein